MNINCCKNCIKRSVGCHAICKEYAEEKMSVEKFNKNIRDGKKGRYDAIAVREDRLVKSYIKCNVGQK